MSVERDDQERPCLHCVMVELIDDFFAEYPAASGEPDVIDTDEVVTAIAKTVAELTCGQDGTIRQQLIEQLMREIIDYDASFVGTREQVLSALMHAIRQFRRLRRNSRLWSLRTARTCDCHSAWVRTPIRAFPPSYRTAQLSGYLRQRIQLRAIAAVTQ
jgi:hypothetical protein